MEKNLASFVEEFWISSADEWNYNLLCAGIFTLNNANSFNVIKLL